MSRARESVGTGSSVNPPVGRPVRWFMLSEVAVLSFAGGILFFAFDFAHSNWPWELTPFNARFIGGFYLPGMVAALLTGVLGRWAPTRVVLWFAFVFTTVVLIASLLHVDRFFFDRLLTWQWFFLYVVIPIGTGIALWNYRSMPAVQTMSIPPAWRVVLQVQAVVVGLYGIANLVAPTATTSFWPWPVDALHGQLYSALFVASGVSALLLSRKAAPVDYAVMGLAHLGAAIMIIMGLVVTNASIGGVDWDAIGTLVWLGGFAALGVIGASMILYSSSASRSREIQMRAATAG